MDYIFLDSNALVKLYITERGSSWLTNFIVGKQIYFSELAIFENVTTFVRRYLAGDFDRSQARTLLARLTQDCNTTYKVVMLDGKLQANDVFAVAEQWPTTSRIRTLDTIQIAAAKTILEIANLQQPPASFKLVSSDTQLLRVAQVQGLIVENPENYP